MLPIVQALSIKLPSCAVLASGLALAPRRTEHRAQACDSDQWRAAMMAKGNPMDFIERIFGFFPDGGDGTFEFLLFATPVMGLIVLAAWRRIRGRRSDR